VSLKKYIWPLIGIAAMVLSIRILYNEFLNPKSELSKLSLNELFERIGNLSLHHWILACLFSIVAYCALAGYDRIALEHLGRKISWLFIAACSFTTYALSHNIGASVFSGAAVRYRAYSLKGLSGSEIALLVGFCSFTFALGTILLAGCVLTLRPELILVVKPYLGDAFETDFSSDNLILLASIIGLVLLGIISLYIFGSWLQFKPFKIGKKFQIAYPRLTIVAQQLIIGPLELLGAAGIIYSALPDTANVEFIVVLGAFLASFTVGLLSNAPGGGLGVLEVIFIGLIPGIDARDLLVALIVFRLLYLIIPLIISLFFVAIFEVQQYHSRSSAKTTHARAADNTAFSAPSDCPAKVSQGKSEPQ